MLEFISKYFQKCFHLYASIWFSHQTNSKVLVTQLCPTLLDLMVCSPPGSSVHGILQAKLLEWVAIPFSKGSSRLRDWNCFSCVSSLGRWILYYHTTRGITKSETGLSNWACTHTYIEWNIPNKSSFEEEYPFPPSSPGRLGAHLIVLDGNEQEQAQEGEWDWGMVELKNTHIASFKVWL